MGNYTRRFSSNAQVLAQIRVIVGEPPPAFVMLRRINAVLAGIHEAKGGAR